MTATRTKRKLADVNCSDNPEKITHKRLKLLKVDGIKEEIVCPERITPKEEIASPARINTKEARVCPERITTEEARVCPERITTKEKVYPKRIIPKEEIVSPARINTKDARVCPERITTKEEKVYPKRITPKEEIVSPARINTKARVCPKRITTEEDRVCLDRKPNNKFNWRVKKRIKSKLKTFQKYKNEMDTQMAHYAHAGRLLSFLRNVHPIERRPDSKKYQIVDKNEVGYNLEQVEYLQLNRRNYCKTLQKYKAALSRAVTDEEFEDTSERLEKFFGSLKLSDLHFSFPRLFHRHLTNENVMSWLENEENICVLQLQNKSPASYGNVSVKRGRYWISNLSSQRPEGCPIILSLNYLFRCFGGPNWEPRRAFLQLGNRENITGEIIVATDDVTPMLISKWFLCSELKGKSFQTKTFLYWAMANEERRMITYQETEPVVERNATTNLLPSMKRPLSIFTKRYLDNLANFKVAIDGRPVRRIFCKFGVVKEGVKICQKILEEFSRGKFEEIFIHDCGIVL